MMQKKILLVEDEQVTREGIEKFLTVKGYEVFAAKDGEKALRIFNDTDFDLVILDIMLPRADGFTVLRSIREYSQGSVLSTLNQTIFLRAAFR